MVILLYGQMVAMSVATEKSSRTMELLITSAKPINMMFGTSNFKTIKDDLTEAKDFYTTSYEFTRNGQSMYEEDTKAIGETEKEGDFSL